MNIKLQSDEKVMKSGFANHFKGIESVGGKLVLTNKRLYFKSHKLNFQNHELSLELKDIKEHVKVNTLSIVPNGLKIILKSGEEERFVLNRRNDWIKFLNSLL